MTWVIHCPLELRGTRITLLHTHIWSLEGENHVFCTHVVLEYINDFSEVIEVKKRIKDVWMPIISSIIPLKLNWTKKPVS